MSNNPYGTNPYAAPPAYTVPPAPNAAAQYPPQQAAAYPPGAYAYPQQQPAYANANAYSVYSNPGAANPHVGIGMAGPQKSPVGPKPHTSPHHAAPSGAGEPEIPAPSSYSDAMAKRVRMGFIRKVYAILGLQLLVTFGIVCLFAFSNTVKTAVQSTPSILYIALGVSFGSLIALACCPGVAKNFPGNIICLSVFTLAEAYVLGAVTSYYDTETILWALGALVILVVGLTAFAWQTKIDFTLMSGSLFVILLAFILFGIWASIFRSQVVQTVYAAIGVIIFGVFLVYDTQLVIGGKHHSISYTSDDYVFAALNLYIDVIQLFLFLLRLMGNNRN